MSLPLIYIITALYLGVAISSLKDGNGPTSLVFAGYCIGNLGFIWSMWK